MTTQSYSNPDDEKVFAEFRRKVRSSEVLSSSIKQLLKLLGFSGKVCVVVQNGNVLKTGYEEGYFRNLASIELPLP